MDPDVRKLVQIVTTLVEKVDGLIAHYTAIDADYGRVRNTLVDHEERIQRLEQEHNFEPQTKIGESSALFTAIKSAPAPAPAPAPSVDSVKIPDPIPWPIKPKSKLKRFINTIYEFLFVRRFFS